MIISLLLAFFVGCGIFQLGFAIGYRRAFHLCDAALEEEVQKHWEKLKNEYRNKSEN